LQNPWRGRQSAIDACRFRRRRIRDGRVTGPNSLLTGPRWSCYSGNAKALANRTCVQEKSHRATGPHIDTCVCHLAGSRHLGRPGYLNCGDRLGKPDSEQGAHALIVLSVLGKSLGKSVGILSALGDSVEKVDGRSTLPGAQACAGIAMRTDDRVVGAILLRKRIIRCRKLVAITQVACQMLWQCVAM